MLSRGVLLRSVARWLASRVTLTVEARGSIFQRARHPPDSKTALFCAPGLKK